MDIKRINFSSSNLSNKIIYNEGISFRLWLEFEETFPQEDIENDFANVIVFMLDGRRFGINTWTFKFLETAIALNKQEKGSQADPFIVSPDLFVKELTRNCIEQTISLLLQQGSLEQVLNPSVFGLNFLFPWEEVDDFEEDLKSQIIDNLNLRLTINDFDIIAKRVDNNQYLLETNNLQLIKVSYPFDKTLLKSTKSYYSNKVDFWKRCLKQDIEIANKFQ